MSFSNFVKPLVVLIVLAAVVLAGCARSQATIWCSFWYQK